LQLIFGARVPGRTSLKKQKRRGAGNYTLHTNQKENPAVQ